MYAEYRPDRRLARLVECGWARSGSGVGPLRVLPDGCVDLFVSSHGDVMIAGPATGFYDMPDQDGMLAGLRLRPGTASAVVGRPVDDFTDRRVPLDTVGGIRARHLAEKVFTATTPGQRVTALQDILIGHLAGAEPSIDTVVTQSVAILRRCPDRPVARLAAAVGVSERQLRRRFVAAVGYGPKRLGRIVRFQRLLDMIHDHDRVRWAELAIGAGYADQAHMINECVALAGAPPTALPRGVSVSSNTAAGAAS